MVSIPSLWLPILLSAVFVFLASWIMHMFLPYHRSDFAKVPNEGEVQDALRRFNIPPGDYMLPNAGSPAGMKSPEFQEKFKKGPVLVMTVFKGGSMNMGGSLAQWFVYLLIVGVFAAYVTGRALQPGATYLEVFRFAGCTAFLSYSGRSDSCRASRDPAGLPDSRTRPSDHSVSNHLRTLRLAKARSLSAGRIETASLFSLSR